MDELEPVWGDLQESVRNGVFGLFSGLKAGYFPSIGPSTFVAGNVTSFGDEWIVLQALWFVPKAGFQGDKDTLNVRIAFQGLSDKCLHVCPGIQVVCIGDCSSMLDGNTLTLRNARVCFRPEHEPTLPVDVMHLFCGAYGGWSQAVRWLDKTQRLCLGQEMFIDRDPQVMTVWNAKHCAEFRRLPLDANQAWSHAKNVGLCGNIADPSIIDACRSQANLVVTMSPPCQSWSKGGLRAGIEDSNGQAFLDALVLAFSVQTTSIAAECADDIVTHPHFKIVKALASALGYELVWDQVTPYHVMTSHARSRWLGVWVRADLTMQAFPFQLRLPSFPRTHWTDQCYQFPIPSRWISQLQLSDSECRMYDSVHFLPPAKRARFENKKPATNEVIRSRIPNGSDVLPTLCASYSRQHHLAEHHLKQKGIFACLQESASGFRFLDPALFCSLFGTTEHVVLSEKIEESFHFVGNAITVPHGVLALSIVLHATSSCAVDPIGLVREVWAQRLTAYNAILFAQDGLVHLIPIKDFWKWVSIKPGIDRSKAQWTMAGSCADVKFEFQVHSDQTIQQIFRERCCIPQNLLLQICGLNSDIRICNRTTIEQIACQENTFRLVLGFATLGHCELHATLRADARTKVIDESSSERAVSTTLLPIRNLDDHCEYSIFLEIQRIVETLQDDIALSKYAATVVVLPEQLSITVYISNDEQSKFLQRVASLPLFSDRNKRFCSIQGEPCQYLLISTAQFCEHPQAAEIIVRINKSFVVGACMPDGCQQIDFSINDTCQPLTISQVNGSHVPSTGVPLQDGDIVDVYWPAPVHVGGHHHNLAAPPTLPAFSDFTARTEFMCDTHGWVATDEMFHYTQALQWQQDWLRFGSPQLWDITKGDFEAPIFGELDIPNNCVTAIPVLIGSHWAGIEVTRRGSETSVLFVQVPERLHVALTFLVARLLDIAPHRFLVQSEFNDPPPHTCGWNLIFRWYRRHGIHQGIADISNHMQLTQEYNDLIQIAMQCSCEDWALAQISIDVGQLAYTLRKNFLCFLARRELQGRPQQQIALYVACPPPTPQPQAHTAQPDLPPVHVPRQLDRTQIIIDRIRQRVTMILLHPGWMSSDELDISLEGPRAMNPQTLFCPPSSWNVGSSSLHFLNDYIPDYRAFNQVIWIIEVDQHWVQAEAYLHEDASNFAFTFPANSHIRLQPLVDHLINVTGARDTQIAIHFYDQQSPMHMCGYHLVAQIYHRLAANTVPLQAPQRRQLSFHPLAADLDRAHFEARALWTAAGADPHLIDFAANIRQWFLVRVAENRFPAEYISAGGQDQPDVQMKTAEDESGTKTRPASSHSSDKKDPWLKSDPWLRSTPRPAQSKWEDLIIKEPIPFTGTDGASLLQTHRLQVGGARGGIVFATKAHVQDIAKCAGSNDLAILLPASDNLALPMLHNKLQGPYEVSVDDVAAKIAYKRLVMLFIIGGTISFKLPTPVAKLTTGAVCEIVLEIDGRLVNKSDLDRFRESPIATFKNLLSQIVPKLDNSAVLFGYRVAHHPGGEKQDPLLQCILKAPHAVRTPLIEASGFTPLLTRDFLEKGRNSEDTTVLPRFWPPTMPELSNIRKTVDGTDGLAGLALTRRGIAPRVWVSKIGKARAQLLADDPRVLPENIDVIPRFTYSLAGWPAATGASHVVTSVIQALKIPALPLRTYRAAGVHVWIVTTDKKIDATSFPLQINADVVEILIQEIEHGPPKSAKSSGKGQTKGKGKNSNASEAGKAWTSPVVLAPTPARPDEARIQRLEDRFDKIEARQATFESRVDGKFDSIQDALRQILANANARAREPSGESPPTKHSKQC